MSVKWHWAGLCLLGSRIFFKHTVKLILQSLYDRNHSYVRRARVCSQLVPTLFLMLTILHMQSKMDPWLGVHCAALYNCKLIHIPMCKTNHFNRIFNFNVMASWAFCLPLPMIKTMFSRMSFTIQHTIDIHLQLLQSLYGGKDHKLGVLK